MREEYITLSALTRRLQDYESQPIELLPSLKSRLRMILGIDLVCILTLLFVPPLLIPVHASDFGARILNFLIGLVHFAQPILLAGSIASALIIIVVSLTLLLGIRRVPLRVHWISYAAVNLGLLSGWVLGLLIFSFVLLGACTVLVAFLGIVFGIIGQIINAIWEVVKIIFGLIVLAGLLSRA